MSASLSRAFQGVQKHGLGLGLRTPKYLHERAKQLEVYRTGKRGFMLKVDLAA